MWVLKEGENGLTLPASNTALPASNTAPTGLTPNPYQPHPQPLSKGRGEWYALCIDRLLLVNLSTR